MDAAGIVLAPFSSQLVAAFGDLPVGPTPKTRRERDMHQRSDWPQHGESSGQVADRIRTPVTVALSIDHVHLLHQRFSRQIGVSLGDSGVVQRDEREPASPPI